MWEYQVMEIGLIFTALLSGGFIGAVLGFIGAGGAMVSVPILLYLFDFTPVAATTAALAVVFLAAVFLTGLSSSITLIFAGFSATGGWFEGMRF